MNYYVPKGVESVWFINGATGVVPDEFQPVVADEHQLENLQLCVFILTDGYIIGCNGDNDKDAAYEDALKAYFKEQE